MLCDRRSCTKAYHLPCLGLGKRPFGGFPLLRVSPGRACPALSASRQIGLIYWWFRS